MFVNKEYEAARADALARLSRLVGDEAVVPLDDVVMFLPENPEWTEGIPRPRRRK
jgi:hypothetical protein